MVAPNTPITYILPDEGWAPLLEIIVREAPSGSVIEVNTAGMYALAKRMLWEVDRQDVAVELCSPRNDPPGNQNIVRQGLPGVQWGGRDGAVSDPL